MNAATEEVNSRQLMPPFAVDENTAPAHAYPPVLNLTPEDFFTELLSRYLFVALQEIGCTSLMSENQKRIQHMTTSEPTRRYHTRRQEEITEEIEVILINATMQA